MAAMHTDGMPAACADLCTSHVAVYPVPPGRRYDFLYRLAERHGGDGSAALLPNFVFSQALARWYQEQGEQGWSFSLACLQGQL